MKGLANNSIYKYQKLETCEYNLARHQLSKDFHSFRPSISTVESFGFTCRFYHNSIVTTLSLAHGFNCPKNHRRRRRIDDKIHRHNSR